MNKAVRIYQYGDPDVLTVVTVETGSPAPDQVRVRHTAIGLNYIDVYQRTGLYPVAEFPQTLGMEAAGVIEEVGSDVSGFAPGDRVAYAMVIGSYCDQRLMTTDKLVKLPDTIDDQTAAGMMLQGMTARYLLKDSYPVQAGDAVLVMAAAGGVGSLLSQWANHLGATVIGCVGSEEKAERARQNGCQHTILYNDEDVVARVRDITGGEGVAVSYDAVGKATLEASLDALRPTGILVSYGNSSGPITDFNPGILAQKGSLYLQRPTLATYTRNRQLLDACASDLFDVVSQGVVKVNIGQTYPLIEVAQAHRDLEARQTMGSTVLLPESGN